MTAALLSVDRIDVAYGRLPALRGVSVEVGTGEIVALQLTLRDHGETITIERAEVMWARKDTAGFRFVEASAAARAAVDSLTAASS